VYIRSASSAKSVSVCPDSFSTRGDGEPDKAGGAASLGGGGTVLLARALACFAGLCLSLVFTLFCSSLSLGPLDAAAAWWCVPLSSLSRPPPSSSTDPPLLLGAALARPRPLTLPRLSLRHSLYAPALARPAAAMPGFCASLGLTFSFGASSPSSLPAARRAASSLGHQRLTFTLARQPPSSSSSSGRCVTSPLLERLLAAESS